MKLKSGLVFLIFFCCSFQALALEITLDQPPGDYRVYNLNGKKLNRTSSAKNFNKFKFQLPDQYIVENKDGSLNLRASLNKWRRKSGTTHQDPITRNGIGFFPFKDSSGVSRYIALDHIAKRYKNKISYKYTNTSRLAKKRITPKAVEDLKEVTSDSGFVDASTFEPTPEITKIPVPQARPVIDSDGLSSAEKERRARLEKNALSRDVLKQSAAQLNQNQRDPISQEVISSYNVSSELSGGDQFDTLPSEYARQGIFNEQFPPRRAKFSRSPKTAKGYNNREWAKKSTTQKANYLNKKYKQLLKAHGLQNIYPSGVLVCKAYKESTFNPNVKAYSFASTASGISQVTKSTAKDLFNRGKWFRSKVNGFTHIRNGQDFHFKMSKSMLAQMELGLAILHQKSRDNGTRNVRTILKRYYGNKSASANNKYADSILNCYKCAKRNGFTKRCLDKVYK